MLGINSSIIPPVQVVGGKDIKGKTKAFAMEGDALKTSSRTTESLVEELLKQLKIANEHNKAITDKEIEDVEWEYAWTHAACRHTW